MRNLIFIAILFAVANGSPCPTERGESTLNNICYCEDTSYEFGNKTLASVFDKDVTIGFISDSGIGPGSRLVLDVLKANNVDAVVHVGDFDYTDSSSSMENNINSVFPSDFPYFYIIGNHDLLIWDRYQRRNLRRLSKDIKGLYCIGNLGVKTSCVFKGVQLVLSGAGTLCDNHEEYIESVLSESAMNWKVCAFHKVHSTFQLGSKGDEVDLSVYQSCIDGGALVITGHDHVYGRTHLIKDAFTKALVNSSFNLIKRGQSIVWVNGLGGYSQFSKKSGHSEDPWWDVTYGRKTGSEYGALICTFSETRATCEFKNIEGDTQDSIVMYSDNTGQCVPSCPECTKSWLSDVNDGCGGVCPQDNCGPKERCSSSSGYTCVIDVRCYVKCLDKGCIEQGESQPTNWCGGRCNLPYCSV